MLKDLRRDLETVTSTLTKKALGIGGVTTGFNTTAGLLEAEERQQALDAEVRSQKAMATARTGAGYFSPLNTPPSNPLPLLSARQYVGSPVSMTEEAVRSGMNTTQANEAAGFGLAGIGKGLQKFVRSPVKTTMELPGDLARGYKYVKGLTGENMPAGAARALMASAQVGAPMLGAAKYSPFWGKVNPAWSGLHLASVLSNQTRQPGPMVIPGITDPVNAAANMPRMPGENNLSELFNAADPANKAIRTEDLDTAARRVYDPSGNKNQAVAIREKVMGGVKGSIDFDPLNGWKRLGNAGTYQSMTRSLDKNTAESEIAARLGVPNDPDSDVYHRLLKGVYATPQGASDSHRYPGYEDLLRRFGVKVEGGDTLDPLTQAAYEAKQLPGRYSGPPPKAVPTLSKGPYKSYFYGGSPGHRGVQIPSNVQYLKDSEGRAFPDFQTALKTWQKEYGDAAVNPNSVLRMDPVSGKFVELEKPVAYKGMTYKAPEPSVRQTPEGKTEKVTQPVSSARVHQPDPVSAPGPVSTPDAATTSAAWLSKYWPLLAAGGAAGVGGVYGLNRLLHRKKKRPIGD